jgi:hypothetical protein
MIFRRFSLTFQKRHLYWIKEEMINNTDFFCFASPNGVSDVFLVLIERRNMINQNVTRLLLAITKDFSQENSSTRWIAKNRYRMDENMARARKALAKLNLELEDVLIISLRIDISSSRGVGGLPL